MTTAYITHPDYTQHDVPNHPERPARMKAIWQFLADSGLSARMKPITPIPATDAQLLAVHTQSYLSDLAEVEKKKFAVRYTVDTVVLPDTPAIARLSAGGASPP